jgi:hypothetical protein
MKILLLPLIILNNLICEKGKIGREDMINDFRKTFKSDRFTKYTIVATENYQDHVFGSTVISSDQSKKGIWTKINSVFGRCDYIVNQDSISNTTFYIISDKAYQKFWVIYNSAGKISAIKIVKLKVTEHLVPPPCGY